MGFLNLDRDRKKQEVVECRFCGTRIGRGIPRPLEFICVICRAAILDRIFKARHGR